MGYRTDLKIGSLKENRLRRPLGAPSLLRLESTHAIFREETPIASLRINSGINHQDFATDSYGTVVVPEQEFWKGNIAWMNGLVFDDNGLLARLVRFCRELPRRGPPGGEVRTAAQK